jgi:hypothetical protein
MTGCWRGAGICQSSYLDFARDANSAIANPLLQDSDVILAHQAEAAAASLENPSLTIASF